MDFLDNRDTALELIAAWLSDIPRVFGARARFEALRDLAREGISPDVLPLALDVVATALDGAPQLQAYAIWELAGDANERDQVCALLKLAYGYTQCVWCDDNLHNIRQRCRNVICPITLRAPCQARGPVLPAIWGSRPDALCGT